MQVNIFTEAKNAHSLTTEKKRKPTDNTIIPDEINLHTCLNCPLPKCKPRCGLLKREKK